MPIGPSSKIESSPRDPKEDSPNCIILDKYVFDNLILALEPFLKALQSPKTFVSVNYNLYGNLVSSLQPPTTFDRRFKVTWVPIFIPDFNLLSC